MLPRAVIQKTEKFISFGKNFEDKIFLKNLKLIKDEKFHLKLKSGSLNIYFRVCN